ncbi:MAG TPA: hypothetical protein PK957_01615, partial [Candidatus Dojkabacteria bacterium]|nr:hypothetical protein [Candidatus Dojkabacteria bacterium]HQF36070.1 hypothetical protein [Candidatus Dojkabacteria bacterium]
MIKNKNSKATILKITLGVISIAIVFMVGIMSIDNSYAGKTISYTGRLRDSQGNVVGESNEGERFDMVFRLYNSASGGSLVWGPEVHYNVLVKYGYFGVDLGSILPINLSFNEDYYVSVAVKKSTASSFDSEMYPRAKLSSSAYSFTSENVNGGLNKDVYIRTTSGRNIYLLGNRVGIGALDPKQSLDVNGNIGVKGIFINDIRKDDLWDLAYAERGSQIAGTGLIWSDGVLSIVNPYIGTDLEFLAETRELSSSTGTGVTLPLVTTSLAGLMSETDKSKLDGIASGAQPGTVTSVDTGSGLTGGPITTSGTISIATGGVTNAMLLNSSLTVTAGNGLSGGGIVSLGGSTTLSTNAVTCGSGEYSYWTGTAWACRADIDTNTVYTHPTGFLNAPLTALSGANVISSVLVNTDGHVTGVNTRAMSTGDLGATTVGNNLFTMSNPGAITFLSVNADNSVSALDASTFRTAIGAGTSSLVLGTTSTTAYRGDYGNTAYLERGSQIAGSGLTWNGSQLTVSVPFVGTNLGYTSSTRELSSSTGTGVTLPLVT